MHGLYLSRKCEDITQLSSELLGLHCWFHRNVAFSALIRGADLTGWNIEKGKPVVELFTVQPKRIKFAVFDWVDEIRRRTAEII